ncbi:MAG TPA: response regulator [Planctomycetes bacterium]|nr:response regulator [Fuerstiella sp.]HIK91197.1 response regulator [Planctomycetota bacterium]
MPSKIVLSVGQCRPDNAAITHFLTSNFDVEVLATDLVDDSLTALQKNSVDLILINRKLDTDYSDGMEIMKQIRSNPQTEQIPVMLISNFPESQEQAVAAGATYGFGKAELSSPETVQRVRDALGLD